MTDEFRRRAKNLLLLDIETVASHPSYELLTERMQKLWDKKALSLRRNDESASNSSVYYDKGAIYAEFGKVVCIAFGAFFWNEKDELSFKVRSFSGDNEIVILNEFKSLVEKYAADQLILCAHNGKEFDFPYLCRRMLVNGIQIPKVLHIAGKKPWEVLHQDTMELWKFGDYKSFSSLDLLAAVFDIPGSKNEMSGDQVTKVYYEHGDIEKISRYCREDVVVMAQIYLKLHGFQLVEENNITRVE